MPCAGDEKNFQIIILLSCYTKYIHFIFTEAQIRFLKAKLQLKLNRLTYEWNSKVTLRCVQGEFIYSVSSS